MMVACYAYMPTRGGVGACPPRKILIHTSTEYDVRVKGENAVGSSVPSVTMRAKTDGELRGLHR